MSRSEKARSQQPARSGPCCVKTFEELESRREERRGRPQPWILMKGMVFVVIAIIGYSAYVYIGRLIVPALRGDDDAAFSRSTSRYSILLLVYCWTYARITLTSPGFAVDHVEKTPAPTTPPEPALVAGQPYQHYTSDVSASAAASRDTTLALNPNGDHGNGHAPHPAPSEGVRPELQRRPNPTPVLRPEYRYCYREGFIKPKRTHHCRACGKCVLAYDHHCPWIGQCVGARNARYFFVFLVWTFIYCVFTLTSLVISLSHNPDNLDGQQIAIVAISALFTIFSIGMIGTHIRLTLLNQTTVESMTPHSLREQERAAFDNELSCWDARTRRRITKRWDYEWGNPDKEGNIWWLGSAGANWRARMGDNPLGWFLPLATHNPTGLDYEVNPRFDADGRWRRREEWPAHLR